jgi:phosphohistidine phosphatase
MKKLIFIRHGRAEDPAGELSDFERSLTIKGKVIANTMADILLSKDDSKGLIITSPAFRAFETAVIFAGKYGIKPEEIRIDSNLYYNMNLKYLTEILKGISDDTDKISFFGHNPSFTEISDRMSKGGCEFMPKCGVAALSFSIDKWSAIKPGTGKLEYFLKPDKTL